MAVACARSIEVAAIGDQVGSEGDDGGTCVVSECEGKVLACGDCVDNDQDGVSDAADPDCWGECHDSEESWSPRQLCSNESCFFDRNCGLGNDDECVLVTPNGCDCHGCCEVGARSTPVFLGTRDENDDPTCSAETASEPAACASCVLDEACFNACEAGERCL